jgi:hypothetical protein
MSWSSFFQYEQFVGWASDNDSLLETSVRSMILEAEKIFATCKKLAAEVGMNPDINIININVT